MATDWAGKISEAKERLAAAEAAVTDDDRAEIAVRAEHAQIVDKTRAAEELKRDLDLERRREAAVDVFGSKVPLDVYVMDDPPHTFVIRAPKPEDHTRWEKGLADAQSNKKIDQDEVKRNYALACVFDWNGSTDLHGLASAHGLALRQWAEAFPAAVTSITNIAAELGGLALGNRRKRAR